MPAPCTWQFNFRFSLEGDMYAQESTAMLAKSGIEHDLHQVAKVVSGVERHPVNVIQ
jgi:hypothetical protein